MSAKWGCRGSQKPNFESLSVYTYTSHLFTLSSSRCLIDIPYLEGGLAFRCFQRFSFPNIATRLCTWQYNRHSIDPLVLEAALLKYLVSDGHSTFYRRITKPYFRICLTCWFRSQHIFKILTIRSIRFNLNFNQTEYL